MTNPSQELFIHDVDANTRDNIIRLDQKLRGLRTEIEFKLSSSKLKPNEPKDGTQERLSELLKEINLAINAIEQLVNMVIPEEKELKTSLLESEDMRLFKEALEDQLKQITKLINEF